MKIKVMNIFGKLYLFAAFFFIIWFFVSFANVDMHNTIKSYTYPWWNFFKVFGMN